MSGGRVLLAETGDVGHGFEPTEFFFLFSKRFTMREIVHLQAGQGGNQIGAKVSLKHSYITTKVRFLNCENFWSLGQLKKAR